MRRSHLARLSMGWDLAGYPLHRIGAVPRDEIDPRLVVARIFQVGPDRQVEVPACGQGDVTEVATLEWVRHLDDRGGPW